MKIILIIILVILAGCGGSAPSVSNPEPAMIYAKDFIKVDSFTWERDSIGDDIISGKVRNTSVEYTLVFVELRGTIYDKSGKIVNTRTSFTDSDQLAPGSTSTFKLYVDDPSASGIRARVEVESAQFQK